jgi:hypothetical protein
MGIYLQLHRFPQEQAVDVLTRRRWFYDLETAVPQFFDRYNLKVEELRDEPPYELDFLKYYDRVLDALTGRHTAPADYNDYHEDEAPDDWRWWAVYGRRRVGWAEELGLTVRYNVQPDIEQIGEALRGMSQDEIREHVERVIAADRAVADRAVADYVRRKYESETSRRWIREKLVPRLLPALRQFYRAAVGNSQIVICRLH